MARNYVTHSRDRPLPPTGSQESEGGSLGTRDIKLQHTIISKCPKQPAGGKVRDCCRKAGEGAHCYGIPCHTALLTWGWSVCD